MQDTLTNHRPSYHSPKALLMMKQHRIGRVTLPWSNLEPPIRRGPAPKPGLDEKNASTAVGFLPKARDAHSVPRALPITPLIMNPRLLLSPA